MKFHSAYQILEHYIPDYKRPQEPSFWKEDDSWRKEVEKMCEGIMDKFRESLRKGVT